MLDTNICSFIIRKRPVSVLHRLQKATTAGDHICISAITYAELLFGANSRHASPKMPSIVAGFVSRLDSIAAWSAAATNTLLASRENLVMEGPHRPK